MALADRDPEGAVVYWRMGARRDSTNAWLRENLRRLSDSLGVGRSR
jgi:hypothetical protein